MDHIHNKEDDNGGGGEVLKIGRKLSSEDVVVILLHDDNEGDEELQIGRKVSSEDDDDDDDGEAFKISNSYALKKGFSLRIKGNRRRDHVTDDSSTRPLDNSSSALLSKKRKQVSPTALGIDDRIGRSDDDDSDKENYVSLLDSDNDAGEDVGVVEEGGGVDILDLNVDAGNDEYEEHVQDKKKRRRVGSKKRNRGWNKEEVKVEEVEDERVDEEIPEDETVNEEIPEDERVDEEILEDENVSEEISGAEQHEEVNVETNQKIKKNRTNEGDKPTLMWEIWEEENERFIDENFNKDTDLDNHIEAVNETAEASSDLIIPLLTYQKEWLAWALKQEDSPARGGILSDEMGMGKTLQAIALVLAKRKICQEFWEPFEPSLSPISSTALPKLNCTLVICPVVAVSLWVNEIDRFTTKGSTKVLVYHGAKRGKSLQQFSEYDFVITTYSIIESEYRKHLMPPKTKCPHCERLFHEKQLRYHLRLHCGPDAVRTQKQSKQERKGRKQELKNLDQAAESVKGEAVEGYTGKGISRKTWKQDMKETYAEQDSLSKKLILHFIKWDRIILDEAHTIKDRQCNTAKGVFALESSYKWALSGTPLQNRVGELYSLVRFLQVVPYSFYLCKDCDCQILDYRPASVCSNCPHESVKHFCWWNKFVANPITSQANDSSGRRAMILLRHKLLKSILLRRTKKGRAADLALPPRTVSLRRDTLDIKEEDYYESLYNESQAQFNTYVQEGTLMNNYAHIFVLLMRLRQAVDHPYLVVYSRTAAIKMGSMVDTDDNKKVCGICNESAKDAVITSCEHIFCKECLIDYSDTLGQVSCPSCFKPLTVDLTSRMDPVDQNCKTCIKGFKSSSILNRIPLDNFQTSTKIDALREEIRFMIERDGSAKGIVFSQFTSFLDLINYSLQKSGVTCVQLVGSMSMPARDAAIARFTEDPDCKIFLMSLKAGGVALNLTVASHVFLMDPWWNPAVERQAQDRIHRIGQYKPIRIVRFVIENTIEERILQLQAKKELVFEGTVGGSSEALGKLTEADLKFLFV